MRAVLQRLGWKASRGALVLLLSLCGSTASAVSPGQLEKMLARSGQAERVVVIDIRSKAAFAAAHIPGSLNIPAAGIEQRPLPGFGRVVVVWDGIEHATALEGVAALSQKSGIQAELLEGGFPAWPAARTSGEAGLLPAGPQQLTYDQLAGLREASDVVVVDLRSEAANGALTDVSILLPNARLIAPRRDEQVAMRVEAARRTPRGEPERDAPAWLKRHTMPAGLLYVLLDDGDGLRTDVVAPRLRARGLRRVFVLTGGELALRSGGQAEIVTQRAEGAGGD